MEQKKIFETLIEKLEKFKESEKRYEYLEKKYNYFLKKRSKRNLSKKMAV